MVEIIIPWADGCRHRARALAFVLDRYAARHPGWRVTVAEAPPGAWCKALAVNPAVAAAPAGAIVIVADADVWTDGLAAAVAAVEAGAPWAIPHRLVWRLSEEGTAGVYSGGDWRRQPLDQKPYVGIEAGGFVVARRETLLDVPLDERFVSWGQEDMAWSCALRTLAGEPWRGHADLYHLWHPPQPRMTRRRGSPESWRLYRRYAAARGDRDAMRALVDECQRANVECG